MKNNVQDPEHRKLEVKKLGGAFTLYHLAQILIFILALLLLWGIVAQPQLAVPLLFFLMLFIVAMFYARQQNNRGSTDNALIILGIPLVVAVSSILITLLVFDSGVNASKRAYERAQPTNLPSNIVHIKRDDPTAKFNEISQIIPVARQVNTIGTIPYSDHDFYYYRLYISAEEVSRESLKDSILEQYSNNGWKQFGDVKAMEEKGVTYLFEMTSEDGTARAEVSVNGSELYTNGWSTLRAEFRVYPTK